MGDIVNLKKFRKERARLEKEREAKANRARFGRAKDEKRRDSDEVERRERILESHRRDDDGDEPA